MTLQKAIEIAFEAHKHLPHRLACQVKLNDLTDNTDIRRMTEVTEKDVSRLNKYLRAYRQVSAAIDAAS